jgi:predicted RNase H-like HicB family nuclease
MSNAKDTLKYPVVVYEDFEGYFVVIVPAIEGCTSFGDTYESALLHTAEAAGLYLEVVIADGNPIPLPTDQNKWSWVEDFKNPTFDVIEVRLKGN